MIIIIIIIVIIILIVITIIIIEKFFGYLTRGAVILEQNRKIVKKNGTRFSGPFFLVLMLSPFFAGIKMKNDSMGMEKKRDFAISMICHQVYVHQRATAEQGQKRKSAQFICAQTLMTALALR